MAPCRARARPAALLFSSLRWVFSLNLENFPIYQTIYGAVSAVPIFVV